MALLRMLAFRPAVGESLKPQAVATSSVRRENPQAAAPPPAEKPAVKPAPPEVQEVPEPRSLPVDPAAASWDEILPHLGLTGMTKMFASHCTLQDVSEGAVLLALSQRHDSLKNDSVMAKLEKALGEYFNTPIRLKILLTEEDPDSPAAREKRENEQRQLEAEAAIASDPVVEQL